MKHSLGRMICAGAAALIVLAASAHGAGVAAQDAGSSHKARANTKAAPAPPPIAGAPQQKLPPRTPFSAADDAVAAIPGMPDARFWADSKTDFEKALPPQRGEQHGSWLILSTGGSDGAFGAGLLNGLSAAGKRPDYAVVTGVSTGALMAPFVFAGPRYDAALAAVYTHTSAADIFEVGGTGESFLDTWPLRDLIAKQITPALLADIAAAHQAGRRLFIVTTNLDAGRSVVWNMGAIAVHFTEHSNAHPTSPDADAAIKLFRNVLLASGSVPGAFPPVLIEVEGNGKRFAEMHVDGGVGGQFFVTPQALMQSTSTYKIPADALYVVVNSDLQPDFQVVERNTPTILAQTVAMAIKADLRVLLDRAYVAAKNSGIGFNVATIPESFNAPSRGAFDPDYMKALFNVGYDQGKGPTPFANEPPAFPAPPANGVSDPQPGANR